MNKNEKIKEIKNKIYEELFILSLKITDNEMINFLDEVIEDLIMVKEEISTKLKNE